uniref:Uncharacterized protein n=1 Tax=Salix viminalis TaxID=40686 RepID=A0A6N2KKN6_SALVM
MRGATRGLPRRSPILVLLSPKHLWNRYCDRRIFRISRFHPGALVEAALVNSGTKYRVDCGGGGVVRLRCGEGHSFEPHSLIAVGLQRLSGITTWGEKRGELSGADKKEKGTGKQNEGCNTRTSQEVTHPSTTLAQARLTAEF